MPIGMPTPQKTFAWMGLVVLQFQSELSDFTGITNPTRKCAGKSDHHGAIEMHFTAASIPVLKIPEETASSSILEG
jgi:hypothetical protein